jgi:hypothetical protein
MLWCELNGTELVLFFLARFIHKLFLVSNKNEGHSNQIVLLNTAGMLSRANCRDDDTECLL